MDLRRSSSGITDHVDRCGISCKNYPYLAGSISKTGREAHLEVLLRLIGPPPEKIPAT